jgi:hypothetical protein
MPLSLAKRFQQSEPTNDPSYIISLDENPVETTVTFSPLVPQAAPEWLIPFRKLSIGESLGKGQVGDYSKATFNSKGVSQVHSFLLHVHSNLIMHLGCCEVIG